MPKCTKIDFDGSQTLKLN